MFYRRFSWATGAYSIFLVIVSGNYPEYANYKPCARLKNTVNFQGPICLDNGSGGFEEASRNNCEDAFRRTCPEFNKAACLWLHNISFPNSSVAPSPIPCCQLNYYARHYTWLEIYYTLQYGPGVPVYDIVEIRRNIKNHESFGDRNQNDWPESVLDPQGERGLTWSVVPNLTAPLNVPGPSADFCVNDNDTRCDGARQYFSLHYPAGFDGSRVPRMSQKETDRNATLRITYSSACRDIWVDAQRSRACQVLYWYNSTYSNPGRGKFDAERMLVFVFLEVQVYFRSSSDVVVRHAYWSTENPETRDQIFNMQHAPNVTNSSTDIGAIHPIARMNFNSTSY